MKDFDKEIEDLEKRSGIQSLEWFSLVFVAILATMLLIGFNGFLLAFLVFVTMAVEVCLGPKKFDASLPWFYFHSFCAGFVLMLVLLSTKGNPAVWWFLLLALYIARCGVQIARYLRR